MKSRKFDRKKAIAGLAEFKKAWTGLNDAGIPMVKEYFELKALVERAFKEAEERIAKEG